MSETTAKTILVIDDQPSIQGFFQAVLESCGHIVITSSDGEEAIKRLRQEPIDLIIVDLVMPGKEGLETIALARREFPELKILVVSGFEQYFKVARMLGADETLSKPVKVETIRQKLRELIGG